MVQIVMKTNSFPESNFVGTLFNHLNTMCRTILSSENVFLLLKMRMREVENMVWNPLATCKTPDCRTIECVSVLFALCHDF